MDLDYILSRKKADEVNPFAVFNSLNQLDQLVLERRIRAMPYREFLLTIYWYSVSFVVKAESGMRCQICNGTRRLSVHHRTYDTHGREHRHLNDLVALDSDCHALFHGHISPIPLSVSRNPPAKAITINKTRSVRIVPHTEADIVVPDVDSITLTAELINACRANGSFTNATLRAFGMTRSLMFRGWVDRLIGKSLTREQYRQAQEGRFIYKAERIPR